jgi:hypothetical protein
MSFQGLAGWDGGRWRAEAAAVDCLVVTPEGGYHQGQAGAGRVDLTTAAVPGMTSLTPCEQQGC